jgi:hypothetical protein
VPFSRVHGCSSPDCGDAFERDGSLGSLPTDPARPFRVFSTSLHLGFAREARQIPLVATDNAGNSLTMTETIPCERH